MKILRSVTYLYTPEVYSTQVRSTGLSLMNVFDKIAAIVQPMVMATIIYSSFRLSMAIFGFSYLITFVFSLFLTKETANKPMAESYSYSQYSDNDTGQSAMITNLNNSNMAA